MAKRFSVDKIASAIRFYSYKPAPVFKGRVGDIKLGFECEVANIKNKVDNRWAAAWLQDRPVMKEMFYCKSDVSIDHSNRYGGFEIVSHPATLEWWQEHKKDLVRIQGLGKDKGFQGFGGEGIGMHVHLDKSHFGPYHLYKFLKLIYGWRKFSKKIAGKWDAGREHYCSLNRRRMGYRTTLVCKSKMSSGRYSAVNLQNSKTIEIRMFDGTIVLDTIFKNLEYCHAAWLFSREHSLRAMRPKTFREWVREEKKAYPHLADFFDKNWKKD